jgi:hypothetical protein
MSKTVKKTENDTLVETSAGKSVEELKEVTQNLQLQKNQENELLIKAKNQVQIHQQRILKMQGALEVMLQLIPKEEVEKMIAEETKAQQEKEDTVEG